MERQLVQQGLSVDLVVVLVEVTAVVVLAVDLADLVAEALVEVVPAVAGSLTQTHFFGCIERL